MIDTRFPDFYIVGQPKAGTTALYEMLRRHPNIFMPELKEPYFFASELRRPESATGTWARWVEQRPSTEQAYLALFAAAAPGNVVGEASPTYLWSRSAARRIAAVRPDARIIVLFREPAAFINSYHTMQWRNGAETEEDLRKAMELESERRAGRRLPPNGYWPELLFYSDQMCYVDQLRRFTDCFSRDQVLVLTHEEFRRDNTAAVKESLRFLGVDDTVALRSIEVNPSYRVRSWRGHKALVMIGQGRGTAIKKVIMPLTTQRLRRRTLYYVRDHFVHGKPRPPDERLMLELRHRYRDEVVNLGEFLGRDLVKEWGYDQL
jgi:glycerophosphoryl diester phosphodiesterase